MKSEKFICTGIVRDYLYVKFGILRCNRFYNKKISYRHDKSLLRAMYIACLYIGKNIC